MRTFSIVLFLVLISTFTSAEIYKWVDENGRINFSDKPLNSRTDYYVPKTVISSFEEDRSSKATEKRATNKSRVKSPINRQSAKEMERVEKLQAKSQRKYRDKAQEREKQRKSTIRSSPKDKRPFAETQVQHDRRTNYDGYGSELSRYQNAIIMKTHNSVIKGGNMEYWNGLDDYRYKNQRRGKVRRQRW